MVPISLTSIEPHHLLWGQYSLINKYKGHPGHIYMPKYCLYKYYWWWYDLMSDPSRSSHTLLQKVPHSHFYLVNILRVFISIPLSINNIGYWTVSLIINVGWDQKSQEW
jgi:hypothetical protein